MQLQVNVDRKSIDNGLKKVGIVIVGGLALGAVLTIAFLYLS